jgi:hypothetical protein
VHTRQTNAAKVAIPKMAKTPKKGRPAMAAGVARAILPNATIIEYTRKLLSRRTRGSGWFRTRGEREK